MNDRRTVVDAEYISAEDQLDGDTAAEFASFIDDMNSTENADAWITVMRIPTDSRGTPLPNSKHMGQLFNEPLGTSSVNDVIERIRREFIRPGESSITVRIIGKQQGMKGLKFNRIYTIERPNKSEASENGGRESLGEIMRIMADNQRATDERIERLLAARVTTAPVDPLQQVTTLLTALSPLMAAVAGRPAPPPTNGAAEMLATLKVMKEASSMFGGNSGGDDEGSTMKTVRAVAEAVAPGLKFLANKSETERMTVAERLRRLPPPQPPATPAPKPATAKAPPSPVRPNPPPNKTAAPAPNKTGATAPEGEDVNLKDLREKLEMVALMCDEGQTPEAVAELIVDNVEDDQLEELYRRVEPENAVAKFAVLAPAAVKGREGFFGKLRLAILAQYEDDPDSVPADGGGGGETPEELGADPVDLSSIPDVQH